MTTKELMSKIKIKNDNKKINDSSELIQLKNKNSELEINNKNQKKLLDKYEKKTKEQIDEIKKIKLCNETLLNEVSILQKAIKKISTEKQNLENIIEDKKKYILKIETKLLSGANNKFLMEVNNKNKVNIERFEDDIMKIKNENDMLNKKNLKLEQEIKILNQAIDYKLDDYYMAKENKQANKENKKDYISYINYINTQNTIKDNKDVTLKEKNKNNEIKIQELEFAKQHLTELLVEKEELANNAIIEKESFENHAKELENEKNMLKECLEKIQNEQKIIEIDIENETKNYQNKIKNLQTINNDLTQKISLYESKINTFDKTTDILKDKYNNLENNYKKKVEDYAQILSENDNKNNKIKSYENQIENLTLNNEELLKKFNELNQSLHKIENENFDLLSKIKIIQTNKENSLNDLVKQNLSLTQSESKLKLQIEKLLEEIEKLKSERDSYKVISQEICDNSDKLIKEKNTLEQEKTFQTIQIEKLKNNNLILQRGFNNSYFNNNNYSNSNNNSVDNDKKQNQSILDLVRKEKEKSKNVLIDIQKIEKNKKEKFNQTYN